MAKTPDKEPETALAESQPAAEAAPAQAQPQAQRMQVQIDDSKVLASYANFCLPLTSSWPMTIPPMARPTSSGFLRKKTHLLFH